MSTKTKASSKNKKASAKSNTKKVVAEKAVAKKSASKPVAKAKPAKKSTVKAKPVAKKAAPKKVVKKAVAKKVVAKKASRQGVTKKVAKPVKKAVVKKVAPKKIVKPAKKVIVKAIAKKAVVKAKPTPVVKIEKPVVVKVPVVKPEKVAKVKKEKAPIIKKPIVAPTTFRKDVNEAPAKFIKEPNGKFEIEFVVRASEDMVFEFVSTESGLSEWFCDDVNIRDGVFTFNWDGQIQQAKLVKEIPPQLIRYQWVDKNDGSYFEFRIQKDDLTNDVSLMITDFASDKADEVSARLLWHSQVDKLLHVLGSFF
jgi:uncharacterized protein YndB with AHSA1/START domain